MKRVFQSLIKPANSAVTNYVCNHIFFWGTYNLDFPWIESTQHRIFKPNKQHSRGSPNQNLRQIGFLSYDRTNKETAIYKNRDYNFIYKHNFYVGISWCLSVCLFFLTQEPHDCFFLKLGFGNSGEPCHMSLDWN